MSSENDSAVPDAPPRQFLRATAYVLTGVAAIGACLLLLTWTPLTQTFLFGAAFVFLCWSVMLPGRPLFNVLSLLWVGLGSALVVWVSLQGSGSIILPSGSLWEAATDFSAWPGKSGAFPLTFGIFAGALMAARLQSALMSLKTKRQAEIAPNAVKEARPDRIEASAIRLSGASSAFSLPRPARHHNVINLMSDLGLGAGDIANAQQGFVTGRGRFVDRVQALAIAIAAGQIVQKTQPETKLFSEDMW